MSRKYFFKSQSSLQRKVIAGGLSAVFGAGMYGSYAGATEESKLNTQYDVLPKDELEKNTAQGQFKDWVNDEVGKLLKKVPDDLNWLKFFVSDEELKVNEEGEVEIEGFDNEEREAFGELVPDKIRILRSFAEHFLEQNKNLNFETLKSNFLDCLKNEYPDDYVGMGGKKEREQLGNKIDIKEAADSNDGIEHYIRDKLRDDKNFLMD